MPVAASSSTLTRNAPRLASDTAYRVCEWASIRMQAATPNLKAVHAGASMRKPSTCNQKLQMSQMPTRRWVVLPFPDSLPTFEYSPSLGKSPLCQQNAHFASGAGHKAGGRRPSGQRAPGLLLVATQPSTRALRGPGSFGSCRAEGGWRGQRRGLWASAGRPLKWPSQKRPNERTCALDLSWLGSPRPSGCTPGQVSIL
jgi:hypothetical protein